MRNELIVLLKCLNIS